MPADLGDRTVIRSSAGFSNPDDLSLDEFVTLSVNSTSDFATTLFSGINWNGGILGCVSISLSADNNRVSSASFHLLGKLWSDKAFNAGSYWNTDAPTQLICSIPDLTIFHFPPGSLCSEYVSSSDLTFSFTQNGAVVPTTSFSQVGLTDFCIRAFCYPSSDAYAKLTILLFPCSINQLAVNPLYLDPYFPGIKLYDSEFQLSPSSLLSPLARNWGFPLAPAVFPGSDWEDAPGVPSGLRVRIALSHLLRTGIKPDVKANLQTYSQRLDTSSFSLK